MTVEASRRDVLLGSTAGAAAAALALGGTAFAQSGGAPVSTKPRSATASSISSSTTSATASSAAYRQTRPLFIRRSTGVVQEPSRCQVRDATKESDAY